MPLGSKGSRRSKKKDTVVDVKQDLEDIFNLMEEVKVKVATMRNSKRKVKSLEICMERIEKIFDSF